MNKIQTIQDADLKNKRVLVRVGFDVPLESGKVVSDVRIRAVLPTLDLIIKKGAKEIILITHLGRPKDHETEFCLYPVANKLAEILKSDAKFNGFKEEYQINNPPAGEAGRIKLLENLRFNKGEEENSPEFSKELASMADIYVDDAFSVIHRDHASITGVAKLLPSYAGLQVQKEVENLTKLETAKEKSFTVILGGAKIKDKLPIIKNLTSRAQNFLIGGAIASTFLAARRHYLGKSLVEDEAFREANIIWQQIMDEPDRNIYLPVDLVISRSIEKSLDQKEIDVSALLKPDAIEEYTVVDIGPKTREKYAKVIAQSKTIFWNGNMGVSEVEAFSSGTKLIADAVAVSPAFSVVGGGDTVGFLENAGLIDKVSFASTGGGATLEFISGKELPGLKVLE